MHSGKRIPFEVDISRVIELLANQIYQSPLALLRENAQNAVDAVLLRRAREPDFVGEVRIDITVDTIRVRDNGVGMTAQELEENFWHAGASGKNTPEAREAGVVGTFGIGAMANFGIAEHLSVVTESASEAVRTRSEVSREDLSATEDCITIERLSVTGEPGTDITARLEPAAAVSVEEATRYVSQFAEFVDIPVFVNDAVVSKRDLRDLLPSDRPSWRERRKRVDLGGLATADVEVMGLASGELRVVATRLSTNPPSGPAGSAVLIQDGGALRTLRSGFGLATVSVPSLYGFGGAINLAALQPTAGREALEARSNDLLNRLIAALDEVVSEAAVRHPSVFENVHFLQWVVRNGRFDLCGSLNVRLEPGNRERRLSSLLKSAFPLRFFAGSDQGIVDSYASDEQPLVVLSRRSPRRDCEIGFLRQHDAEEIADKPQLLEMIPAHTLSVAHGAVLFRVSRIIVEDYFLEVVVNYGRMTHGIPLLVDREVDPPTVYLDPASSALSPLVELYESDFDAFVPFTKDFVRAHVFPKIADLVPSSTREGADALLRRLRSRGELFEISWADREDLESIWERYAEGEISLAEAAKRSRTVPRRSVVQVTAGQSALIENVLVSIDPDVAGTDGDDFAPLPPIDRRESQTDALLLTSDASMNGYRCFMAVTEQLRRQQTEFFFQPHTTSVVWGGQKILFVFQHQSGRFALYYDVQCPRLVADVSGGGPFRTSTILLKNRIFLPVPDEVARNVIPSAAQVIRLEVRHDVLPLEVEEDERT